MLALELAVGEQTMAAPRPKHATDDFWGLPSPDEILVFDERRLDELLAEPGTVVLTRDPERAKRFRPLGMVGHISLEELRRLLGREPDDAVEAGTEVGNAPDR